MLETLNQEYLEDTSSDSPEEASCSEFLRSVHAGLSARQKTLECKYLYDERGSELFDQICDLPEYYPTRTEIGILREKQEEIASVLGEDIEIVELGSGASIKTRILLSALRCPSAYIPVDISEEFVLSVAEGLRADYPGLNVAPVVGDFMQPFELPERTERNRLLFFPGSTIGNLHRDDAGLFLRDLRRQAEANLFLIGVDLKKDKAVLEAAYDDAAGVTAAFNMNLLRRINRELKADFNLDAFRHKAVYNEALGRVEMHLVSQKDQRVHVAGRPYSFSEGETIHSENSYKYTLEEFGELVEEAGWQPREAWTDAGNKFGVLLLEAA